MVKMARVYKSKNSIISFVALAFLMYFIALPIIISVLTEHFGSVEAVILDIIDLVPFGRPCYWFAVKFAAMFRGQMIAGTQVSQNFTISYFFQELTKALFTAVIFEALNLALCGAMGIVKPEGRWNKAKKMLVTVFDALLAACLAPIPINYILNNLSSLSNVFAGLITGTVPAILMIGGTFFFKYALGLSIGIAVFYMLIKHILMDLVRLFASYVCLFFILIGLQEGSFVWVTGGGICLLLLALILAAIDLMLDAAIG